MAQKLFSNRMKQNNSEIFQFLPTQKNNLKKFWIVQLCLKTRLEWFVNNLYTIAVPLSKGETHVPPNIFGEWAFL